MYLQRLAIVGLVTATLAAGGSTVAFAQSDSAKKPLGKMTCEDFLGFEEQFQTEGRLLGRRLWPGR